MMAGLIKPQVRDHAPDGFVMIGAPAMSTVPSTMPSTVSRQSDHDHRDRPGHGLSTIQSMIPPKIAGAS
jgi:hypothetical protein